MTDHRMLLVHAHPDDECINNGATMARYVDEGVGVTLVTCTAGEMGEVLVPELAHLAYEEEGGLGEHRRGELDEAMKVLGVTDHRFLGGFGRFHDSGMAWHEDGHAIAAEEIPDNAFWTTDLIEAADELVKVIREVRPQVLVTYDQFGGYGHPDHIQAHRVAMYAAQLAAVPSYRLDLGEPHDIAKVYWTAMSESRMRENLRQLRESGDTETFAGHGARRQAAAVRHARRADQRPGRRRRHGAAQDGRPRQARHPGGVGRRVLRPVPRAATRGGPRSSTAWSRAPRARSTPTGSRTDLFAGICECCSASRACWPRCSSGRSPGPPAPCCTSGGGDWSSRWHAGLVRAGAGCPRAAYAWRSRSGWCAPVLRGALSVPRRG